MEHAAQKARREVEAKAKKKAKRWRIAEEKKRKKLEYIQQLQNKMIAEDTTLLESTEKSQVARSKHKEVTFRNEERQQPFKKARKKYCRDAIVKIGSVNPCKRCIHTRQDCLVYNSR